MKKILLGSASSRRAEILRFFSIPFDQVSSPYDESQLSKKLSAKEYAYQAAVNKAKALHEKFPNEIILSADTVVSCKGKIFLKPKSENEAFEMLKVLSGSWHEVYSSVCVHTPTNIFADTELTKILFHSLSDEQIQTYHKNCYFHDKAGGYAIQRGGSIIVKRIEGCYYNIMGLPLNTMRKMLYKAGIDLWEYLKPL